jgi:hypothetical protein
MLITQGKSAAMPSHPEQTACHKNLWVEYDVTYSGDSMEGVFDELERSRDQCAGFLSYEPGLSPTQHIERQEQERRERLQWRTAKLSFFGGLGALIGSLGSNIPRWFVIVWKWAAKTLGAR